MDERRQTSCAQRQRTRRSCPLERASWASGVLGRIDDGNDAKEAAFTEGTAIRIATCESAQEVGPRFADDSVWGRGSGCFKELPSPGEKLRAVSIGQEAEVPDADEATWEYVLKETTDEVWRREGEQSLAIAVATVAIAEGHAAILEGDQALVADGDAVGVAAQVLEHLSRTGHGRLAVDHPVFGGGLPQ